MFISSVTSFKYNSSSILEKIGNNPCGLSLVGKHKIQIYFFQNRSIKLSPMELGKHMLFQFSNTGVTN